MDTILKEYLERRLISIHKGKPAKPTGGPVVTISREYGCPAKRVAGMLSSELNRRNPNSDDKWLWVGKEIMEESAKELHLKKN